MLEKIALGLGAFGVGFSMMFFLMHRQGAPLQEQGIVPAEDDTSPYAYVAIGVGALLAGAISSHVWGMSQSTHADHAATATT